MMRQARSRARMGGVVVCLLLLTPVTYAAELMITRKDGVSLFFTIEVASDSASRARGLMFRSSLPERHGMWFDFETDTDVTMWMKNTAIALDMLFVAAGGGIRDLHEQAEPYSLQHIKAKNAVRYVLELNAGEVARFGITRGDRARLLTH